MSYAGGLELKFFESNEFESYESKSLKERDEIIPRNALRLLMMGWDDNWKELKSWRLFKAIILKRDKYLMRGMRLAFQDGFDSLFKQLSNQNLNSAQLEQAQLFISNCLSLLPFSDINPYESFKIPQWLDDHWEQVEYKVTPIELTPTSGFKKLFIYDEDRVFAYGLEPINNRHAQPHLIFMGTTYPAGQGFYTQINTDLEAFETVGKKLYRQGRDKIIDWLKTQPNKAHVCGMSLGGSLSLLLAIDQGDKISRVDAHNPAGLYEPWRKSRFDNWDTITQKPDVIIQKQGNDPVSRFGVWKNDWTVLQVTPHQSLKGPHDYFDHALNYAGHPETQFDKVDTSDDNIERKHRNFWLYTLLRSATYYFGLIPFRYAIRPIIKTVFNHKLQLTLFVGLTVLFCFFPVMGAGITIALLGPASLPLLILNAAVSAFVGSYLLATSFHLLDDVRRHKKDSTLSKAIAWFNSRPLWQKVSTVLGGLLITAAALCIIFFPPVSAVVASVIAPIVLVAAIPLLVSQAHSAYQNLKTLLGKNDASLSKLHQPTMPRNESLDIYQSKITKTFSYQQLHDYYFAKRVLLKKKPLITDHTNSKIEFDGQTKQEILQHCLTDISTNEENVSLSASKAKINDIETTLNLIKRFGIFDNKDELILHLNQAHQSYSIGKHQHA